MFARLFFVFTCLAIRSNETYRHRIGYRIWGRDRFPIPGIVTYWKLINKVFLNENVELYKTYKQMIAANALTMYGSDVGTHWLVLVLWSVPPMTVVCRHRDTPCPGVYKTELGVYQLPYNAPTLNYLAMLMVSLLAVEAVELAAFDYIATYYEFVSWPFGWTDKIVLLGL